MVLVFGVLKFVEGGVLMFGVFCFGNNLFFLV